VVTYFALGPDYTLSASITKPPAEMEVTSSALLVVSDKELRLSGQFILAPAAEDLFRFPSQRTLWLAGDQRDGRHRECLADGAL